MAKAAWHLNIHTEGGGGISMSFALSFRKPAKKNYQLLVVLKKHMLSTYLALIDLTFSP